MAAGALIEILAGIAPESAKIIERLQQAKLNDRQIMISLLALNLEGCRKQDCIISTVRDLRADMARKGMI